MQSSKSWLEISEARLRRNYQALACAAAAGCDHATVLAVIKAGAYGHGAEVCAPVLADAGAPWLGVTDADEGAAVRRVLDGALDRKAQPRILVMWGILPDDVDLLLRNQLTPIVWTSAQIEALANKASTAQPLNVHLEVDTGMSRQGITAGPSLDAMLDRLTGLPALRLEGVLTHFASAEISGALQTRLQQQRFETALDQIQSRELYPDWIHAGNSSTVDEVACLPWLQAVASRCRAQPMVRSGFALYGYTLPLQAASSSLAPALEPVLTWKTRVLAIEDIPAGATVGYNATFTAPRPMRLALLPVGYADGLRRELSSTTEQPRGWVTLKGQRAPIVGRISMNLTTVDVTEVRGVTPGDEVTVLGKGITADDHASLAHTIAYEILCGLRAQPRLTT